MFQINTSTKKFTEAASLNLGQLPTTDAKIDFRLNDGAEPVIAEGKTFTMTIGSVQGTLYKTDGDTVSFRYLKFDNSNVSATPAIVIKMGGVEILNDTISLTYQTSGGGGSTIVVDEVLDESSPNPVANSTLTPIINSKADSATTLEGYGITDAYTKTEIDSKVASVYRYKGTVTAYADLPVSGQEVGNVYNVETADSTHGIKAGDNVAWNGTTWDVLAGEIDLSAYATKAELSTVATTGNYDDLTNKPDLTAKLDAPATAGNAGQVLTKTADGQEWADVQSYTLPIATNATLGGIKVGSRLSIDSNGVLSADAQSSSYTLPVASASTLGGVKVDNSAGALKVAQDGLLALLVSAPEAMKTGSTGIAMNLKANGGLMFQTVTDGDPTKALGISPKATYNQLSGSSVTITPSVQPYKLTASGAVTLNSSYSFGITDGVVSTGDIAYAEIVIVLGESGSITAGMDITLVDALTAGKTNYCVVRWEGNQAKLFVWRVE